MSMKQVIDQALPARRSPRKRIRQSAGERIGEVLIYGFIVLLSLTCLLPFLHVLSKSISSNGPVTAQQVYLLPKQLNFEAYRQVLSDRPMMASLWFSVKVTLLFTLIGMVLTILAAYPLTRKRLKGRSVLTFLFVFTLYFYAGIVPDFLLMRDLGLLNTQWAIILPLALSPYNMIILKNYFQHSIPDSLEESAFIDGATDFTILTRIFLPLSMPVLATLTLFYAVGRWNAYQDVLFYITKDTSLYTLQYKLSLFVDTSGRNVGALESSVGAPFIVQEVVQAACIMFATIPILIIYPFLQRYFVKGVMLGAVKG